MRTPAEKVVIHAVMLRLGCSVTEAEQQVRVMRAMVKVGKTSTEVLREEMGIVTPSVVSSLDKIAHETTVQKPGPRSRRIQ